MHAIREGALTLLLTAATALSAAAQGSVTPSDIQRLQDNIYQADRDVSQLRGRDSNRASQLQAELDDLRDEVTYLKVKLRKEGSLARAEYSDTRDRIEDIRSRARGDATGAYSTPQAAAPVTTAPGTPAAPAAPASPTAPRNTPSTVTPTTPARSTTSTAAREVPSGTEIDVRLLNTLNSGTAQVEDRFEATTLVDLTINGGTLIPAGSVMRGVVSSVEAATRTNRTAKMTVTFDQLTVNGRTYPVRATVTQALQGEGMKGEIGRTGVGAGVGAVIGGLLGGFKGALAGILIGGGGTIAATEGKELELPQGTVLRVRFDSPVQVG
jgi:TolA-binding protein